MLDLYLGVIGGVAVALGLASRRIRDLPVTEPLVALIAGVLAGPEVLGLLHVPAGRHAEAVTVAAQIVLAIAVMAVALRFELPEISSRLVPLSLLIIAVLIGMAVIVSTAASLLLALPAATAWLLGSCLAPTDPVLASNVVSGEPAERDLRLHVRVLLSIESGANDGLAFALVALGAAAVGSSGLLGEVGMTAVRLAVAVGIGVGLGWVVGRALLLSERHHDLEHSAFLVLTLSLALSVLGITEAIGGQGIVAVFVAGVAYNHLLTRTERREEWEVQEAVNRYLVLPVFTLLGVVIPWDDWKELGWRGVAFVFAVLLLRRLPLIFSLRRPLQVSWKEAAFVGWFGPIGVAALFYLGHYVDRGVLDQRSWAVGTLVIAVSTVVHGTTATPGRRRMKAGDH